VSTDRELLELAAKAAGLRITWDGDNPPYPRATPDGHWNPVWNPLTRDGDALRLAVKLDMDINIESDFGHTRANECFEDHGADAESATRRAIVRAAAEIGKAMP
jgi:hypothetical protein